MKNSIISILILSILCLSFYIKQDSIENIETHVKRKQININTPPCLQVYQSVKKYCKIYNIPEDYMWGLLYEESRYQGPMHWKYKVNHTSSANALGVSQILLSTARGINKDTVSAERLQNDIDYNIKTSCKFLRRLKDKYKDWKVCFGYYNSGQLIINQYALNIVNKKFEWI